MADPYDITNERKLTDQDALVIRAVHIPRSPRYGSVMLAQLFGVSQPTIDRVVKRESYRHLHRLLLPGLQIYGAGHEDLASPSAIVGEWARNKTEYDKARPAIRDAFAKGGYVYELKGSFSPPAILNDYQYAARPVRRVIDPEKEKLRRQRLRLAGLKRVFGDSFDEQAGLAAAGLAPLLASDD
ncbi:hypothetical protein [Paraburkholderia graminis]|uniref:hypothetical protein n=1 Tax=Paraburkholderia graminis TaxID=60548 RepID=UPI0038BC5AD8